MERDYCGFCSALYSSDTREHDSKFWKAMYWLEWLQLWAGRNSTDAPYLKKRIKHRHFEGTGMRSLCPSCERLEDGVGNTNHLNEAQKQVFEERGFINPKIAVYYYSDISLEDLNFKGKTLAQETPFGCLLPIMFLSTLLILAGSVWGWLLIILWISWIWKSDRDWKR
tara:strand:+ start:186 stop:689 length:504 start_codon:yes stop_codon:yes gene_type:complete